MHRIVLIIFFFNAYLHSIDAQNSDNELIAFKKNLNEAKNDSSRYELAAQLSIRYRFSNIDSGLYYANYAYEISNRMKYPAGEATALNAKGFILLGAGDIPQALQNHLMALSILKNTTNKNEEALTLNMTGNVFMELGDYRKAINYYSLSKNLFTQVADERMIHNEISNIGNVYEMMGNLDSAEVFQQQVLAFSKTRHQSNRGSIVLAEMRDRLGNVEARLGKYDSALMHYRIGIQEALVATDIKNLSSNYLHIADLFNKLHQNDSAFYYARKAIETGKKVSFKKLLYQSTALLSDLFKLNHQPDSALVYSEMSNAVKDSLFGPKTFQKLQLITLNEEQRLRDMQDQKDKLQNSYRIAALITILSIFLLAAIILWRNNQHQKKANRLLSKQKELISTQRNDLEKTLNELKAIQAQLIQSEKMASLGELTAGIAHEIQNPLNFINNFSEVSAELATEMQLEIEKGNFEDAKMMATDMRKNMEKVVHHGKRADSIVKNMLQHSRIGSEQKELTDINSLLDEYLRLSYHGLRAKDKNFNANLQTNYDASLEKINIFPQELGRVFINLFNNAFYSVLQKKKFNDPGYEPLIIVSSKMNGNNIEIQIKDNGMGIPAKIMDKIYQPFFTTKPTGEGTGLGLSMSYDIITKAHNGTMEALTTEGQFAEFKITLPYI